MEPERPNPSHRARRWRWIAASLGIALCCGGLWTCRLNPLRGRIGTIDYASLVEEWRARGDGSADHMPDEVPDGVSGAEMRYFPVGFLQATAYLALNYRTTPDDAERTLARWRDRAAIRVVGSTVHLPDGTTSNGHWWPGLAGVAHSETAECLFLHEDEDWHWGVAADPATGDVGFWTERPF